LVPIEVHYMEKNPGMFSAKTLISFQLKKERHGHLVYVIQDVHVFLSSGE